MVTMMLTARRNSTTQRYELVGSSDAFAVEANRYLDRPKRKPYELPETV